MKGVTSTERVRKARLSVSASVLNYSSLQDNSMVKSSSDHTDDDKMSQKTFGVKSIRTEKFDPIYRQVTQYNHLSAAEDHNQQQVSCLSNCSRMLCDRSRAPEQTELYEAYLAPNRLNSFDPI